MSPHSSREVANFASVSVIGLGYIGLPTAAFIASKGIRVFGVDVSQSYVDQINRGEAPFYEPDFEATLAGVVHKGLLTAQTHTPSADAYIVAVPTPFTDDHNVDLKFIEAAAAAIAKKLTGGELIVLESTSPPGTTGKLASTIATHRPDLTLEDGHPNSIYFAHAPERVLPGRIMVEMAQNDRVIGGLTPTSAEMCRDLYSTFSNGELLVTDARTAEMAKLAENSFRDVNIAFANELSIICDRLDIDVWELIELANHHPRVNILQPGPGVGGHCIAVDPWFIVSAAPQEANLIRTARETNDAKPSFVIEKVLEKASGLTSPTIAALGITFKADIDDVRESPALNIVECLAAKLPNAQLQVVEPNLYALPPSLAQHPNVNFQELDQAITEADIVLLLVDHASFKRVDPSSMVGKVVVDTRGTWR